MRDIIKNISQGKAIIAKHSKADIRANEIDEIIDIAYKKAKRSNDAIYYAVVQAFYTGVAVGSRQ